MLLLVTSFSALPFVQKVEGKHKQNRKIQTYFTLFLYKAR